MESSSLLGYNAHISEPLVSMHSLRFLPYISAMLTTLGSDTLYLKSPHHPNRQIKQTHYQLEITIHDALFFCHYPLSLRASHQSNQ